MLIHPLSQIFAGLRKSYLSNITSKMTIDEQIDIQQKKRSKIRRNLKDYFNVTDLQEICFDLGIDYENLRGDDKGAKVMELIIFMEQRGKLQELLIIGQELRPNLSW